MAIEIKIPKEINRYEAKFIGPFTMRQSIALVIALPICVVIYNFARKYMPMDVACVFCFIPGGVAALFGWVKPYGMHFEKFLQSVFISSFVAPSKRKYCTENYFSILADAIAKEERAAEQTTKKKKAKYKRSKKAIK